MIFLINIPVYILFILVTLLVGFLIIRDLGKDYKQHKAQKNLKRNGVVKNLRAIK